MGRQLVCYKLDERVPGSSDTTTAGRQAKVQSWVEFGKVSTNFVQTGEHVVSARRKLDITWPGTTAKKVLISATDTRLMWMTDVYRAKHTILSLSHYLSFTLSLSHPWQGFCHGRPQLAMLIILIIPKGLMSLATASFGASKRQRFW